MINTNRLKAKTKIIIDQMNELIQSERRIQVEFLRRLDQIDRQRLYLELGYSTCFAMLTKGFHLSESAASRRIRTVRAARRYPIIYQMIASGELHTSSVSILASHLTDKNYQQLLRSAVYKSREEIEQLVNVDIRTKLRDRIKFVAVPKQAQLIKTSPPLGREKIMQTGERNQREPVNSASTAPSRVELEAKATISFTTSIEKFNKIKRAKQILSHKFPHGRFEDVFGELVDFYLKHNDPSVKKLRKTKPKAANNSRYISQELRKRVYQRDGSRCSYLARNGTRCSETNFLEIDHIKPFAIGGSSTDIENLRLLCRSHNQHAARESFNRRITSRF